MAKKEELLEQELKSVITALDEKKENESAKPVLITLSERYNKALDILTSGGN